MAIYGIQWDANALSNVGQVQWVESGEGGSTTPVTVQINAGSDDGYIDGYSLSFNNTSNILIGNYNEAFFRFNNITVPPGVTIQSAFLKLTPSDTESNNIGTLIKAEKTSNSTTPLQNGNDVRVHTTNSVAYTIGATTKDVMIVSPNISSVISEVIALPGWVSGNSIQLTVTDNDDTYLKYFYSYNQDTTKCPILEITYQASSGGTSTTIQVDTKRQVRINTNVQEDTKRQIRSNISALIDTARNVTYLITATINLDTWRTLKNNIAVNTDLQRRVKSNMTTITDTQRKLAFTNNPVLIDLSRKLAGVMSIVADTSRIIGRVATIQSVIQPDTTSEQDVAVGALYQWDQVYLHLFYQDATTNTPVLIQFNLSSIPDNATITRVELQLCAYSDAFNTGNNQIGAYKNLATFNHKTVTIDTMPSCNTTPTYVINDVILKDTWHTWDLTGDIQSSELVNNVVGWTLKSNVSNHGGNFVSGNSTVAANRPKLVISYYVGTSAILASDSQRKLKKANSVLADTQRSLETIILANAPVDTRRLLSGVITPILHDSKRIIVIPASDQADTKRGVVNQASANADSKRLLSSLVSIASDSLRGLRGVFSTLIDSARKVTNTQGISGDSKRKVTNTNNVNADSKRSLTNTIAFSGDLVRKTLKIISFQGDAFRKVVNGASLRLDSFRKVVVSNIVSLDMKRSLLNSVTALVDLIRFVRDTSQEIIMMDAARIVQVSQNVASDTKRIIRVTTQALSDGLRSLLTLFSFENESKRSVELSDEAINDSERKPTVDTSIEPETSRKLAGAIEFVFDSLRTIVNILIKKGPTYIFKDVKSIFYFRELEENYLFKEMTQAYTLKELPESYEWKGLNSMYQFRLGEEKEVGVEVLAKDSTSYALSARWEFEGQSGSANIDNHKVFTVIEPKTTGSKKCVFTVTVMPAGTSVEQTLICPVMVNVTSG